MRTLDERDFAVMQQTSQDTNELLSLDEFLDLAYAEENFQAALDHKGKWKAFVDMHDVSD